ncbi:MAG: hypothetical protein JWQ23_2139 [Herminiimonas sp.]|nr:hypothetical protein [Herminiimonas sp.]
MKKLLFSIALVTGLSACATTDRAPEGPNPTQAMTDMDGRPIYPGATPRIGIGFGFGSWGHGGGGGVGIGTGW